MKEYIKKIVKKLFNYGIDARTSAETKIAQLNLYLSYRKFLSDGRYFPSLKEVGFRCFSQFEEDGLLLYIFALIGFKSKIFIDIGAGDGINSNCANLAMNWGWTGMFVDGDQNSIACGKEYYSKHPNTWTYPPKFLNAFIKAENINELISNEGFSGEIDFLSIDIDGNDFWIWKALNCISPRVVMIETHIELGLDSIVVPYNPNYRYPSSIHKDYFGASAPAMIKLFKEKGYRLIGSNGYGFNLIFMKVNEGNEYFPEITAEEVLSHPRNIERLKIFESISKLEYIHV